MNQLNVIDVQIKNKRGVAGTILSNEKALQETAKIFSKDNENNNWKALVSRHKTLFEGSEQLNGVKDIMMETEFTSEDAMLV